MLEVGSVEVVAGEPYHSLPVGHWVLRLTGAFHTPGLLLHRHLTVTTVLGTMLLLLTPFQC